MAYNQDFINFVMDVHGICGENPEIQNEINSCYDWLLKEFPYNFCKNQKILVKLCDWYI